MTEPTSSEIFDDQAEPQSASSEPDPFTVLQNLQDENASLKDRLLRTLADMENLRRRTDKEVGDAKSYGVTSFARDMLPFGDNLSRALANVPEAARQDADGIIQTFIQGVELTEFRSLLENREIDRRDGGGHPDLLPHLLNPFGQVLSDRTGRRN